MDPLGVGALGVITPRWTSLCSGLQVWKILKIGPQTLANKPNFQLRFGPAVLCHKNIEVL